jgi:hypothetical protein
MLVLTHLRDNKTSYVAHFKFALCISARLLVTALAMLFHAIIPIVKIPRPLSLSGTSDYLFDKDYEIRERVLGPDPAKSKNV